jgi:coenzyme F420-0:L-glutamate ligase/coenzyme F420-1:gamma-L-glutamate ligase
LSITVHRIHFDAEVQKGDDLPSLIQRFGPVLCTGDIVVVTQKVISKAEGAIISLSDVEPSAQAVAFTTPDGDPRLVEIILRQSRRVVRHRGPLLITETHHGFVCANAGVDRSNAPEPDTVVLLPCDADASADELRRELEARTSTRLAVIIADTMGRPLRQGIVGTAIGVSGMAPLLNLAGLVDPNNYELATTVVAVADELAAAADLALGKLERVPAVVIRGYIAEGSGSARELLRDRERDLFL